MKKLLQLLLVTLSLAMFALLSPVAAETTSAHATKMHVTNGCGDGVVCMYTDSGYSSGITEQRWYQYGCVNLSNEEGDRYIFNNQYDGASVTLYKGNNCGGDVVTSISSGTTWEGDITPVNSISLNP